VGPVQEGANMSAKSYVKRKRVIRSYAGFTINCAKQVIKPITENAYEYSLQFLDKKITHRTYTLRNGISWDVRGTVGAVKSSAPHTHLVEYGVPSLNIKPKSFVRSGKNRALREAKKEWKDAKRRAYVESARG
jgi:hypothetical protein